jgi:UDP-N-acetyl-alpha-D-quinovosamine dehydrogenase
MAGAGSDAPSVAVTGADGFIGRALVARLREEGFDVRAITRATHGDLAAVDPVRLASSLRGVDSIFHLAARAHVMDEREADPDAVFRAANVVVTGRIARAARDAGVRRFVLASTAKVNGEATRPGRPFRVDDPAAPQDAYARSKRDAESLLADVAANAPMSAVVLRLPLVYGPGVRGNFRKLWDAVAQRRWLPFAAIDNRRSLVGLGNLVDAFVAAMQAPAGTWFVADAESVSTPQLVRAIAEAQQVGANLVYVPEPLLKLAGVLTARRAAIERLTSSLEVDARSFCSATGWQPRRTLADELARLHEPVRSSEPA